MHRLHVSSALFPSLLLALACSDTTLLNADDTGLPGTDDDSATEPTTAPDIYLEAVPYLESLCFATAYEEVLVRNIGTAPLTVSELTNVYSSQGVIGATPALELPTILEPNATLSVTLDWTPDTWVAMNGELRVASDDPDTPTSVLGLQGGVASDGTEPVVTVEGPLCMTFLEGDPVSLVATIYDSDDPASMTAVWTDGSGSVLQSGPVDPDYTSTLSATLPSGTQEVTITVTDSCGSTATAITEVTVTSPIGTYSGPSPDGLDFDFAGYLWVADWETSTVYQTVPDTLQILQKFDIPGSGTDGLTLMGDLMLVSLYYTNQVVAFDPCTGDQVYSFAAPGAGVSDVSWDGASLWVVEYGSYSSIYQVDPVTGTVLDSAWAPYDNSNGLTWDGTHFWLTANFMSNKLARLNPDFSVDLEYAHSGTDPRGIAWDGTEVWYSDGSTALIDSFAP